MDDHYQLIMEATTDSTNFSNFDCGTEGLKYVAGYLAHAFRIKYPTLGCKTSLFRESFFTKTSAPWILSLSRGGLTVPSQAFFENICKFENVFCDFHGKTVSREKQVVEALTSKIMTLHKVREGDIVKKFVRTRTFIRIKFLNHQLQAEAQSLRARNAEKNKHFSV